mmetsp:Transcript_2912/g.12538  ORF Transcript_2912/g.12538 Transcript_2912/m.12538 type:complete len:427 (+) Transcript_2912:321-1601(+)
MKTQARRTRRGRMPITWSASPKMRAATMTTTTTTTARAMGKIGRRTIMKAMRSMRAPRRRPPRSTARASSPNRTAADACAGKRPSPRKPTRQPPTLPTTKNPPRTTPSATYSPTTRWTTSRTSTTTRRTGRMTPTRTKTRRRLEPLPKRPSPNPPHRTRRPTPRAPSPTWAATAAARRTRSRSFVPPPRGRGSAATIAPAVDAGSGAEGRGDPAVPQSRSPLEDRRAAPPAAGVGDRATSAAAGPTVGFTARPCRTGRPRWDANRRTCRGAVRRRRVGPGVEARARWGAGVRSRWGVRATTRRPARFLRWTIRGGDPPSGGDGAGEADAGRRCAEADAGRCPGRTSISRVAAAAGETSAAADRSAKWQADTDLNRTWNGCAIEWVQSTSSTRLFFDHHGQQRQHLTSSWRPLSFIHRTHNVAEKLV